MREVEAFKDYLRLKGAKEETIRGYEVAIKTLEPFTKGKEYSELTEEDVLAWLKRIEEDGSPIRGTTTRGGSRPS